METNKPPGNAVECDPFPERDYGLVKRGGVVIAHNASLNADSRVMTHPVALDGGTVEIDGNLCGAYVIVSDMWDANLDTGEGYMQRSAMIALNWDSCFHRMSVRMRYGEGLERPGGGGSHRAVMGMIADAVREYVDSGAGRQAAEAVGAPAEVVH